MFKREKKDERLKKLVNFLLEARVTKHLPKASFHFVAGPLKESVAEHCFTVTIVGWVLAKLERANEDKIIKMCLIHDLSEPRGGERNLVNKFYSQTLNELAIVKEISEVNNLEDFKITPLFKEFWELKTREAKVARDADILAQMMWEKENLDIGNKKAQKWVDFSLSRLKTKSGKELGETLKQADSDKWWVEIVKKYILKTKFL